MQFDLKDLSVQIAEDIILPIFSFIQNWLDVIKDFSNQLKIKQEEKNNRLKLALKELLEEGSKESKQEKKNLAVTIQLIQIIQIIQIILSLNKKWTEGEGGLKKKVVESDRPELEELIGETAVLHREISLPAFELRQYLQMLGTANLFRITQSINDHAKLAQVFFTIFFLYNFFLYNFFFFQLLFLYNFFFTISFSLQFFFFTISLPQASAQFKDFLRVASEAHSDILAAIFVKPPLIDANLEVPKLRCYGAGIKLFCNKKKIAGLSIEIEFNTYCHIFEC